ncbi:MAG: hypothetical protein WCF07_00575 [Nitrososphaeraceae archaeon]
MGTFYIGDGRKVVLLPGFKTESAARDYFRRHAEIANEKGREASHWNTTQLDRMKRIFSGMVSNFTLNVTHEN